MKFLKKINLEINKDLYNPIQVKQNDTARYLLFSLLDNGVPFDLSNKTVRVFAVKPDGSKVFNNLTIVDATDGLAELKLTSQMLAKSGWLKLELVIYEAADILSTIKFDIDVIASLRDDAAIESTNDFSALTLALTSVQEWDNYFRETSGQIEQKYTTELNKVKVQAEENKSSLEDVRKLNIYVSDYCIGDGVVDDSDGMLNMARYVNSIDEKISISIIFNVKSLYISKIIRFLRGNLEYVLNNCEVIWNNSIDIGNENRTYGVFNCIGSVDSGHTIKSYVNVKNRGFIREEYSYIEVEDSSIFKEGELVKLSIGENKQTNVDISPYVNVITKITKISSNKIYFEYSTPWDIPIISDNNYGKVHKITKLFNNISISGIEFYDMTNVEKNDDTSGVYPNRGNLVNLFSLMYVDNLTIKNIKGEKNKFCLIRADNCVNVNLENIEVLNPDIVGGGEGYGVQLNNCTKILGTNIRGTNSRHIIDLTNSNHALLINCGGVGKQYAISQHGAYEHDITYINCDGSFQTGQSGSQFGDASKNITLINCNGAISCRYCENLVLENCNLSLIGGLPHSVTAKNCKLNTGFASFYPNSRNISNTMFKLIDSELVSIKPSMQWTFSNWDIVCFIRSSYSNVVNQLLGEDSNSYKIVLQNVKKFISEKCNTNMILNITGQDFTCVCDIDNNDYDLISNQALFRTYNLTNSKVIVRIKGNQIYPKSNGRNILIVPDLYNVINSSIALEFTGNYIDNKYSGHAIYMKLSADNKFKKVIFKDNLIPIDTVITGITSSGGENILY